VWKASGELVERLLADSSVMPKQKNSKSAGKPYVPEITVPRSWKRHALLYTGAELIAACQKQKP